MRWGRRRPGAFQASTSSSRQRPRPNEPNRRSTMADAMPPAMCSGRSSRPAAQPLPTPMIAAPHNWVDFLGEVEAWIDPTVERIYAVTDNLSTHSAPDVLLFSLLHPRWEFVFQPKYAAYLNLIEPWWKVLRSLALKGRRFETWAEIEQAVERATAYWNEHKHPFIWGRRRRHRPRRRPGIASVPGVRGLTG